MTPPTGRAAAPIALAAAALLAACAGDAPALDGAAGDAAGCSCPAAEPPLAGRIVTRTQTVTIAAMGTAVAAGGCPSGATLLGGGCRLESPDDIRLLQAGPERSVPDQPGYLCQWLSFSATAGTVTGEAICLLPP